MTNPAPIQTLPGYAGMNQLKGLIFSSRAYINAPQSDEERRNTRTVLAGGWKGIDDRSRDQDRRPLDNPALGPDYNVQRRDSDKKIQNAFEIYVDDASKKIAIAFKGSTLIDNFHSNLTDGGKREFLLIQDKAQKALAFLKETHPGYEIFTTGHSLAGGQAQAFGLKNNLSIQVVNSLPIARPREQAALSLLQRQPSHPDGLDRSRHRHPLATASSAAGHLAKSARHRRTTESACTHSPAMRPSPDLADKVAKAFAQVNG